MGAMAETVGSVFWLEQALAQDDGPACPPLAGTVNADVCVVGGGFLGMWAALEVIERAPETKVVVIEAEGCGFGASGRNGGWITSWHDELEDLVARFGPDRARWLAERSTWAIDRIAEVCASEEIDCHLRRAGGFWCATAPAQMDAWEGAIAAGERVGRPGFVERMAAGELRARTGSPVIVGGARLADAAAVQPALLARGLRRVLLRRGVAIYEGTPMLELGRGAVATVRTPAGCVQADAVVLGLGAWAAGVRELRRAVVPVGSHIVVTEPIPERIEELGWTGGELLGDTRLLVHYAQVTRDGRIAFGRGGGAIGPAGRVLRSHFVDPPTVRVVAAGFRRWFPSWPTCGSRMPGAVRWTGHRGTCRLSGRWVSTATSTTRPASRAMASGRARCWGGSSGGARWGCTMSTRAMRSRAGRRAICRRSRHGSWAGWWCGTRCDGRRGRRARGARGRGERGVAEAGVVHDAAGGGAALAAAGAVRPRLRCRARGGYQPADGADETPAAAAERPTEAGAPCRRRARGAPP